MSKKHIVDEVMSTKEFIIFEKRLDNCMKMRDKFKVGEWGYSFWSATFAQVLNTMNHRLRSSTGKSS